LLKRRSTGEKRPVTTDNKIVIITIIIITVHPTTGHEGPEGE
jgi:hypothetical protein